MYKKIKIASSLVLLLLLAGCNSGGMDLGGGSSSDEPVVLSSLLDNTTSSDLGSGNETTSGSGDGITVARVHNPEPATMLLWGMGLAGAALLKRKRKNS